MKYLIYISAFLVILLEASCSKQASQTSTANSFIKAIPTDSDVITVNSVQLSDGNFLVVGKDYQNQSPGWMVKMDVHGTILWQKRLSRLNTVLWKVLLLPGGGYMTAGFSNQTSDSSYIYALTYDNNGNLLTSKAIECPLGAYNGVSNYALDVIRLSSGNYAFAGFFIYFIGVRQYSGIYLIVTDNTFTTITNKSYKPIASSSLVATLLNESPNGTINITGDFYNYFHNGLAVNYFLLRATATGVQRSFTVFTDSIYSESPNCLALNNCNTIIVNGRAGATSGNGTLVNYLDCPYAYYCISGSICIDQLDSAGNFLGRNEYSGYPMNGLINSIKSTSDGGYILCGTVNQDNSQSIVSPTEIYSIKIDANLNQQWTKTFETSYPSFGIDACQTTDGGYLISGFHRSFNNHFDMVLIKTDANGNVK